MRMSTGLDPLPVSQQHRLPWLAASAALARLLPRLALPCQPTNDVNVIATGFFALRHQPCPGDCAPSLLNFCTGSIVTHQVFPTSRLHWLARHPTVQHWLNMEARLTELITTLPSAYTDSLGTIATLAQLKSSQVSRPYGVCTGSLGPTAPALAQYAESFSGLPRVCTGSLGTTALAQHGRSDGSCSIASHSSSIIMARGHLHWLPWPAGQNMGDNPAFNTYKALPMVRDATYPARSASLPS